MSFTCMKMNLQGKHIFIRMVSDTEAKRNSEKDYSKCWVKTQSRSQSLRSPWPAVGKRELWEQPFWNNRILVILPIQSASMAHAWNCCSQSSRFPTAGQGERRLWERDWSKRWSFWYVNKFSQLFSRCEISRDPKENAFGKITSC